MLSVSIYSINMPQKGKLRGKTHIFKSSGCFFQIILMKLEKHTYEIRIHKETFLNK